MSVKSEKGRVISVVGSCSGGWGERMETAFRTSVFDHLGCWIRYKVCSLGLLKIINFSGLW